MQQDAETTEPCLALRRSSWLGTDGLEGGSRYSRSRRLETEVLKVGAACGYVILGEREGALVGVCGGSWPHWDRSGSDTMLFFLVF